MHNASPPTRENAPPDLDDLLTKSCPTIKDWNPVPITLHSLVKERISSVPIGRSETNGQPVWVSPPSVSVESRTA